MAREKWGVCHNNSVLVHVHDMIWRKRVRERERKRERERERKEKDERNQCVYLLCIINFVVESIMDNYGNHLYY